MIHSSDLILLNQFTRKISLNQCWQVSVCLCASMSHWTIHITEISKKKVEPFKWFMHLNDLFTNKTLFNATWVAEAVYSKARKTWASWFLSKALHHWSIFSSNGSTVLSCVVLLRCGQCELKHVVRTLWWKTAKRLVEKDVGHFHKISLGNGTKQQPLQSEDNSKTCRRIHNPHSAKRLVLISYTWPFTELSTKYLHTGSRLD